MAEQSGQQSGAGRSAGVTHVGRVRSQNQDTVLANDDLKLWMVADGLGGHAGGEMASGIAQETIAQQVAEGQPLDVAIQSAHNAICMAQQQTAGMEEMGTTVVALAERDDRYTIYWVGDSRAYSYLPSTGQLKCLTRDHNLAGMLEESGAMDAEQANNHPQRHVLTECLGLAGRNQVRCDLEHGRWQPGEIILLCSDGLSNEIDDKGIRALMNGGRDLDALADRLVNSALEAGGRDNVSVVLVRAPDGSRAKQPWWKIW